MNATTEVARRPFRRYLAAIAGSVAVLLALYALFSGWQTYRHAQSLRARARALQTLTPATLDTLGPTLAGAQRDWAALRRDLALPLALAPRLGWVPRYGPTLWAAPQLFDAGEALLEAATLAWGPLAAPLLSAAQGHSTPDAALRELAEGINAQQTTLQRAAERAREGCALLAAIEADALVAPLGGALAKVQPALPLLTAALDGLPLLPRLTAGEQTYLVLAQNNDELRPTGGFISSIGALTLREGWPGKLSFRDSYAVENWDVAHPDPPEALRKTMELDLWATRDANWWPDFPTSARAVLELYELNQGVAPSGVLALDVYAAAALVDALAPLDVAGQPPLAPGQALTRFRESWGLPPGSLVNAGVAITATRPYTGVEVALHFSQRTGQVWLDTVRLARASAPDDNLIGNASFEDDADGDGLPIGWAAQGLAPGDGLAADRAHTGARSLTIMGDLAADKVVTQRLAVAGQAGDAFILAAESAAEGVEVARGAYALAVTFLSAEGPPETIVAEFPALSHDWASADTARILGDWWRGRKDFMNLVMQAALAKVVAAPANVDWPTVLSTLADLLAQRHIQVYLADSDWQAWASAQGWAGALAPIAGDYLLLVDSNVGFNKVTANIGQAIYYDVFLEPGARPRARCTIHYKHVSAARDLVCDKFAQYVPTYNTLAQGCYWDYVRLYAPPGAELISASGGDEPAQTLAELGRTAFATSFTLRPGEERTLVFEYYLPDAVAQGGAYRLMAQKQAGAGAIPLRLTMHGVGEPPPAPQGWQSQPQAAGATYETALLTDRSFEAAWGH